MIKHHVSEVQLKCDLFSAVKRFINASDETVYKKKPSGNTNINFLIIKCQLKYNN